jgi:CBS domain-containing protein
VKNMLVKNIMRRKLLTMTEDATINDVIDLMVENHAGSVIIVDKEEEDKVVGIVTERDILCKIINHKKPLDLPIKEIMTRNVITISPNDTIEKAAQIMTENKIKKLPVVENGKLVGIITLTDIVASGIKLEDAILQELAKWFPVRKHTYVGG